MAYLLNSQGIVGTFNDKGFKPHRPDNTPSRNVGYTVPKMDTKKKKRNNNYKPIQLK